MPELPEAERARQVLETALGRTIAAAEDDDTYVCRPHAPGEIASALTGHQLISAHRRGKFLWLDTDDGPSLGLHLGMAGRIVVNDDAEPPSKWDRFALRFSDGSRMALRDPRRLGRAVLNPNFSHVGPDAADVSREDFRRLIGSGDTALKARLLNQKSISGIGNLLADQVLWQAKLSPARRTSTLSTEELDRLRREIRAAVRSAVRLGGAHTGTFIKARSAGGSCPRCGHGLSRDRVGGRTTYWCPNCQR
ncbi:MAG TPA: DNA-formamidopyrimidine glycosylase family protein [Solirubrobacteraceae bacterium]|nr:DNA-formamidopyrimidine glycosylase family protein [Solirubrobacteraceae bacterium]